MRLRDRLHWRRELRRLVPYGGNRFEVLAGGPAWFAALRHGFRTARREACVETYIWAGDRIGRLMLKEAEAASRRGVAVRLVLDGFGSLGLGAAALQPLRDAGGEVGIHNPVRMTWHLHALAHRNHRKLAVFDGRIGLIGGFAIRDDWADAPPRGRWDVGARVTGPVAAQFRRVFDHDWVRCRQESLPPLPARGADDAAGHEVLRLLPSVYGRRVMFRRLKRAISRARDRVYIAASYFIPTFGIRRALRRAARRGVDVRLLLPTPRTEAVAFRFAGRRHYGTFLAAGVRIFEYQPSLLHAKYTAIDGRWGVVGSSNLDSWSARLNMEADLVALTPGAVGALADRFLADQRRAREITRTRWARRALWIRALERLFGRFDPWL